MSKPRALSTLGRVNSEAKPLPATPDKAPDVMRTTSQAMTTSPRLR
jgi:hypothetical protein